MSGIQTQNGEGLLGNQLSREWGKCMWSEPGRGVGWNLKFRLEREMFATTNLDLQPEINKKILQRTVLFIVPWHNCDHFLLLNKYALE